VWPDLEISARENWSKGDFRFKKVEKGTYNIPQSKILNLHSEII
jgi:hypothetical protein